ncbi:tyrosine-type recombinase/integrase [Ralstonia sp. VS2407]
MSEPIQSKTARDKLEPRREPYFSRIRTGLYVGYRKLSHGEGSWVARRRNDEGKQEYKTFAACASYDEALNATLEWAEAVDGGVSSKGMTVKEVCEHYVRHLALHKGDKSKADAEGRFKRLVYGAKIGRIDISKLRTSDLKAWLSAQIELDEDDAEDEDDLRRAKDSANRNLASLKAALNLALHDRLVPTDAGWKTVGKFKDVGRRRLGFLAAEQRKALVDACAPDIRRLVQAMLFTGARPGELANANVTHFDRAQGTLALDGKTGYRVVSLPSAAIAFFEAQAKDKIANAPILATEFGQRWNKDSWKKPFKAAVAAAQLPPTVVMYSLRHTAISEMIASGRMDSFEVARMAGTSTEMIDKHYGHLRHDRVRAKLDAIGIL